MNTDAFATAARAEAEGTYNTRVYPGSASTWDQAIQRAAFTEGAEWARDHLAAEIRKAQADAIRHAALEAVGLTPTNPEKEN